MEDCKWAKTLGPDWIWVCEDKGKRRFEPSYPNTVGKAIEKGLKSASKLPVVHQPIMQGNTWDAFVCALGEGRYDWEDGICDWSHLQDTYQIKRFRQGD